MTLAERLNRFPPKLCRLLARKHHGLEAMSAREIADRAGLAESTVNKISRLQKWDNVTLRTIERFSAGCGIDLLKPGDHIDFWRRRTARYIRKANPAQRIMYARILRELSARTVE